MTLRTEKCFCNWKNKLKKISHSAEKKPEGDLQCSPIAKNNQTFRGTQIGERKFLLQKSRTVSKNKTGTSKVGAISKAQKAQFFLKKS